MSIIQRLFRRYSKETQVQDVLSSDNKPQKKYEPDHCEITNASAGNFDGISQAASLMFLVILIRRSFLAD